MVPLTETNSKPQSNVVAKKKPGFILSNHLPRRRLWERHHLKKISQKSGTISKRPAKKNFLTESLETHQWLIFFIIFIILITDMQKKARKKVVLKPNKKKLKYYWLLYKYMYKIIVKINKKNKQKQYTKWKSLKEQLPYR